MTVYVKPDGGLTTDEAAAQAAWAQSAAGGETGTFTTVVGDTEKLVADTGAAIINAISGVVKGAVGAAPGFLTTLETLLQDKTTSLAATVVADVVALLPKL